MLEREVGRDRFLLPLDRDQAVLIEVLRVLHGARDIDTLMQDTE